MAQQKGQCVKASLRGGEKRPCPSPEPTQHSWWGCKWLWDHLLCAQGALHSAGCIALPLPDKRHDAMRRHAGACAAFGGGRHVNSWAFKALSLSPIG
eukprot:scaffold35211_cov112-Isochrysis_galbana.AAC.2